MGFQRSWPLGKACFMYLLRGVDLNKFAEEADKIIQENLCKGETDLKRIRGANGFSKKRLAEVSDVVLRRIQLHEQRQNHINKTRTATLIALAKALNCRVEDLVESEMPA